MCKVCWSIAAVLLIISSGMAYKFIIQGEVVIADDSRAAIQLSRAERDLVLSEMRIFLQSVQQITKNISEDKLDLVANAARKSGRNAQAEVPGSLIGKLPLEFKKLGSATHAKFDELALDAEQLGDPDHTLMQLGSLLENCVSCHAAFKFEIE